MFCCSYSVYESTVGPIQKLSSYSESDQGQKLVLLGTLHVQTCWFECVQAIDPDQFYVFPALVIFQGFFVQDIYDLHIHILNTVVIQVVVCSCCSPKFFSSDIPSMFIHAFFECSICFTYILDSTIAACDQVDHIVCVTGIFVRALLFPVCTCTSYSVFDGLFRQKLHLHGFLQVGGNCLSGLL